MVKLSYVDGFSETSFHAWEKRPNDNVHKVIPTFDEP